MESVKQMRILMLEDNPDDKDLIERTLRKDKLSFVSVCVDTRDEFIQSIRNFRPDVILSDHGLPQFNSREALKICFAEKTFVPFILVTGTMSDEFAIECLRSGANDYILKSNLSRLPLAIRRAVKEKNLEKLKREARHALRKQNHELTKVNKELDSFMYSVSHNLRGPLASLMGLVNIAKTVNEDQTSKSVHAMMEDSLDKLDDTLKEILDYSKNARIEVQNELIEFNGLIDAGIKRLRYLDNAHFVSFNVCINQDIYFHSDVSRINIIINNLFSNAILYCVPEKNPFVNITIDVTEIAATIVIEDNGMGIRNEVMPRIFEMFYRGTEKSNGAGLGLYIVKEAVSRLKGLIDIKSTTGEGTKIIVTIPNMK